MVCWIESVTICGFKSYAHEVTISFQRGLSVMHGPNGCGKSTVIDALLFVLGEDHAKLRVAKLAELRSTQVGSAPALASHTCGVSALVRTLESGKSEKDVLTAELKADRCEHRCARRATPRADGEGLRGAGPIISSRARSPLPTALFRLALAKPLASCIAPASHPASPLRG
jgi:ABC-type Mn2+/Zn2+ transport system ATPase subunit